MDLDTEKTRETHNSYIESTRGSLKKISFIKILVFYLFDPYYIELFFATIVGLKLLEIHI